MNDSLIAVDSQVLSHLNSFNPSKAGHLSSVVGKLLCYKEKKKNALVHMVHH